MSDHTAIRVEIPAYTDMWMRGAMVGTVKRSFTVRNGEHKGKPGYVVKMDHPDARDQHVLADDCRII